MAAAVPPAPVPLVRQGCPITPGDRLVFRMESRDHLTTHLPSGELLADVQVSVQTRLHLRIVSEQGEERRGVARLVGTSVRDAKGEAIDAGDLAPAFGVRLRPDCSIVAVGHRAGAEPRGARVQQALARAIEWRLVPEQEVYTMQQRDGLGEIWLRYGHGRARDGAEVLQRRATELGTLWPRSTPARGQVLRSTGEARLGAGPWFDSAHEEQWLEIQRNGTVERIERRMEVTRIEADEDPFAPEDLTDPMFSWEDRLEEAPPEAPREVASAPVAADLDTLLADAVRAEREASEGKGLRSGVRLLAAYLRANPEAAGVLAERLRRGRLPAELRAPLATAFSLADTPQARAALVSLAHDRKLPFEDRLRAIHGAATTAHPGESVAAALRGISRDPRDQEASRAATLALGTLAAKQSSRDAALSQGLREEIAERMAREQDPRNLEDLLRAAGNTRHPGLLSAMEPLGTHRDPSVRAEVVDALGALDSPEARERQVALLEAESDPGARRAMWNGLAQGTGQPTAALLELAARRLLHEEDPAVARALIEMLGRAPEDPGVREALLARFRQEKRPELLQLLGKFLPATALP